MQKKYTITAICIILLFAFCDASTACNYSDTSKIVAEKTGGETSENYQDIWSRQFSFMKYAFTQPEGYNFSTTRILALTQDYEYFNLSNPTQKCNESYYLQTDKSQSDWNYTSIFEINAAATYSAGTRLVVYGFSTFSQNGYPYHKANTGLQYVSTSFQIVVTYQSHILSYSLAFYVYFANNTVNQLSLPNCVSAWYVGKQLKYNIAYNSTIHNLKITVWNDTRANPNWLMPPVFTNKMINVNYSLSGDLRFQKGLGVYFNGFFVGTTTMTSAVWLVSFSPVSLYAINWVNKKQTIPNGITQLSPTDLYLNNTSENGYLMEYENITYFTGGIFTNWLNFATLPSSGTTLIDLDDQWGFASCAFDNNYLLTSALLTLDMWMIYTQATNTYILTFNMYDKRSVIINIMNFSMNLVTAYPVQMVLTYQFYLVPDEPNIMAVVGQCCYIVQTPTVATLYPLGVFQRSFNSSDLLFPTRSFSVAKTTAKGVGKFFSGTVVRQNKNNILPIQIPSGNILQPVTSNFGGGNIVVGTVQAESAATLGWQNDVVNWFSWLYTYASATYTALTNLGAPIFSGGFNLLYGGINGTINTLSSLWNNISAFFADIVSFVTDISTGLITLITNVVAFFTSTLTTVINWLDANLPTIFTQITVFLNAVITNLPSIMSILVNLLSTGISWGSSGITQILLYIPFIVYLLPILILLSVAEGFSKTMKTGNWRDMLTPIMPFIQAFSFVINLLIHATKMIIHVFQAFIDIV